MPVQEETERGKSKASERIAELEKERQWHFAEIESARRTINNHHSNIRDIEEQLVALKSGESG